MPRQLVYIYADESCLGNQRQDVPRPGAAAGLLERFDERKGWYRRDFAAFDPDTTNNRMALVSGILGLSALRKPCDVVFTSDSQYLVRGMKEWVHGWSRRGWRRKGGPIENLSLWRELVEVAARHQVEWRWVRGHADHPKNEYANFLATSTARAGKAPRDLLPSGFDAWLGEQVDAGHFLDYLDLPPDAPFAPDPAPPAGS
ncbi:MAG: ribonuclease HI [marine benthic group bacterium]|jgi:ribonuclease HI|nr:ribonuclease HI [Candidatus Benthicola marisminoris]